jgi:hypothetical protein
MPKGAGRSRARRLASSSAFVTGQALLLVALFMVYRLGRSFADGRQREALHNALEVWHLERLLDLPDEAALQHFTLRWVELPEFANRFYIGVHFPAAVAFLLWVVIFRRAHWSRVRNVIMISTGAALVIHILYPLAPPRFLPAVRPDIPFVDTGLVFGPSAYTGAGASEANQYAAMPSLHVGWAILEAWGLITILRMRARWLAVVQPVVTALVVVITANHYWLDGLIGGLLVYGAVLVTRPEPWARVTGAVRSPVRGARSWVAASRAQAWWWTARVGLLRPPGPARGPTVLTTSVGAAAVAGTTSVVGPAGAASTDTGSVPAQSPWPVGLASWPWVAVSVAPVQIPAPAPAAAADAGWPAGAAVIVPPRAGSGGPTDAPSTDDQPGGVARS